MNEYQLSFIKNTKIGRAFFGVMMVPAVFLAWTGAFHYIEYEQLVPIWFFIPAIILLVSALLNIRLTRKGDVFTTSINILDWVLTSSLRIYQVKDNVVISSKETKLKGEFQLRLGIEELNVSLVGNIEKHVLILNALFGFKK